MARPELAAAAHLIVNNLGATAHSLYMHGMLYSEVMNYAEQC